MKTEALQKLYFNEATYENQRTDLSTMQHTKTKEQTSQQCSINTIKIICFHRTIRAVYTTDVL
jgi:hypothetical protein